MLRKLAGRQATGVPVDRISSFDMLGLAYAMRLRMARNRADEARAHVWANRLFCAKVAERGLDGAAGIYTFNGAGLELLRAARERGLPAVVEQTIAPLRIEMKLMSEERDTHPGWEKGEESDAALEALWRREEEEWKLADTILCGSRFVQDGIAAAGGPVSRCKVVPYAVEISRQGDVKRETRTSEPLRVLTVGALGLRKGTPYLLSAVKRLGKGIRLRAVGPIGVMPAILGELRRHMEVVGPVPRADMLAHYAWADVFVLPSLYEGSATATYEALACGLPVICTPNTGSVVRDEVDGFIVPARDAESIAERLRLLDSDRQLLGEMGHRALKASLGNTESAYSERLLDVLDERVLG